MEIVGEDELVSFSSKARIVTRSCYAVRMDSACRVKNYKDLARKIAALQFGNPGLMLLFRGQAKNYTRLAKGQVKLTSLPPKIFRASSGSGPSSNLLLRRFQRLKTQEAALVKKYEEAGYPKPERLQRQRILRWSILQHYEVCATPLLDVTHSIRVAASFASDGAEGEAYVYVLGVPNLSGAITVSAEAGLQIIRLSGVCPPDAERPHIQEGYVLGEYPDLAEYGQKELYRNHEVDFGRRLIAYFTFDPKSFWKSSPEFQKVDHAALYPDDDPLFRVTKKLKSRKP